MSYPQGTPQRPIPGRFEETPAPLRSQSQPQFARPPPFRIPSSSSMPRMNSTSQVPAGLSQSGTAPAPATPGTAPEKTPEKTPVERAAEVINGNLNLELRYPALDDFVSRR
jgi:nuclear pore complex protein Nup155